MILSVLLKDAFDA